MTSMSLGFLEKRVSTKWFLFFLFLLMGGIRSFGQQGAPSGDVKLQELNGKALMLLNMGKLDEARPVIKQALLERENSVSYYYLCHIEAVEHHWKQAIINGEKTISMDPGYLPVYPDLFYCYTRVGAWSKAESIVEQVRKADPKNEPMIAEFEASAENDGRAKALITVFLLFLGIAFVLPFFRNTKDIVVSSDKPRFSELFMLAAAVSGVLWIAFYACSEWIWSQNPHVSASEYTPSLRVFINEHDGIESFVLYLMMLINMIISLVTSHFLLKLRSNRSAYFAVTAVLFLLTGYYLFHISFVPPMMQLTMQDGTSGFGMTFAFFALFSIGGYLLYDRFNVVVKALVVLLLAAACLVMILPSSLVDLSFILYPGLRMFYGAKIPDIYFQYDLFLSYLALLWFKLNYSLESFAYLGQVSFFLFFVVSFFFADKFFKSKGLAVIFALSLLVIRYYAIWEVTSGVFQVSPIRLDLWIIPLAFAYWKGARHWLVGLSLGLLVLFHRNLGLIYLASYVELLFVLLLADVVALYGKNRPEGETFATIIVRHIKENLPNVIIIGVSVIMCIVLFKEIFSPSALVYRKLGVGMMQTSSFSFYWYVPIVLSFVGVFVFRMRQQLGPQYSSTAFFALLLTIGESMYFYGRSHENNILNIAGALVLVLFILFDIVISETNEDVSVSVEGNTVKGKKEKVESVGSANYFSKKKAAIALPFIFLFMSVYYYSGRIAEKYEIQSGNFKESQYICPMLPMPMDTAAVRHITRNSPDVYFIDFNMDFYYYYYGHYRPVGYFNPLESWIYRKDLLEFLQGLLDKHYYIVYNARFYNSMFDYIPYLKYNQSYQERDMIAIAREDVKPLLPETQSQFHIAMSDTLAQNGQQYSGVNVADSFCVEVVVKPFGQQMKTASVLSNFNRVNQLKGFAFQSNNGMPGQYIFAFGAGQSMPAATFSMEDNVWHYMVFNISKGSLKVYDNGKIVSAVGTNGGTIVNSDIPLTIGNTDAFNCHFRGFVKEVNITNGNVSEADIAQRAQLIIGSLTGI